MDLRVETLIQARFVITMLMNKSSSKIIRPNVKKNRAPFLVGQSLMDQSCCTAVLPAYEIIFSKTWRSQFRRPINYRSARRIWIFLFIFFLWWFQNSYWHKKNNDYWTLINLNKRFPTQIRKIYLASIQKTFNNFIYPTTWRRFILLLITPEETKVRLYEIDYNSLFENDYSGPDRALNIGLGRSIKLGPENENWNKYESFLK